MDSMKSEVIYNQLVQEFADDDRLAPLLRALVRAQAWCDVADNRDEVAALLGQKLVAHLSP